MNKKEQELNEIKRTYYYRTLADLKKQENKIKSYHPLVDLGSFGMGENRFYKP